MRSEPIIAYNSFPKGNFCLEVSTLKRDWLPAAEMLSDAALTAYVKAYMRFAIHYLSEKGYQPNIRLVDGYNDEAGRFSWQPSTQLVMRNEILSAFLAANLPAKPEYKSLTYLPGSHGKA
jgi:hypothetical protein